MKRNRYWWSSIVDVPPEDERLLYPHPGQVIAFYCEKRQVPFDDLARELNLSMKMVRYTIQRSAGLDSIGRRRYFVSRLEIPPDLLKLDSLHRDAKGAWWVSEGHPPFRRDNDGYPCIQEMIAWYRKQKGWGQTALGLAFDPPFSKVTVNKMEKHGIGLDSIKRREMLSFLLGIPPALLGLDSIVHTSQTKKAIVSTVVDSLAYYTSQEGLFNEYFANHGQGVIGEATWWINYLSKNVIPQATSAQLPDLLKLLARYYHFVTRIAREQRNYNLSLLYANKAVDLAVTSNNNEMLAVSLLEMAVAFGEQGDFPRARQKVDEALEFAKKSSLQVFGQAHTEAGLIHARGARSEREMYHAFVLFDQAEHVAGMKNLGADPYFLKFNSGFYQLKRAMALTELKSPTGFHSAINEAERLTPSDLTRRHLIIDILKAQGKLKEAALSRSPVTQEQCYAEATQLATNAFDIAKQIQSRLNRDRIEGIYDALVLSPYGTDPAVARLGLKLKMW